MELNQQIMNSSSFAQAALDAVSANVCVLDKNGYIIAVNQGWREFFEENSNSSENKSIGLNYLDICSTSSGARSEEALPMFNGIMSVIKDEAKEFTLVYPCHSPTEQRWFRARVTKFNDGSGNIVIAHELITERKLAMDALRLSQARMRAILNNVNESFLFIDLNYKIQFFNSLALKRIYHMFNITIQEGENFLDKVIETDRYMMSTYFNLCKKGEAVEIKKIYKVNSYPRWYDIKFIPVKEEDGEIIGILFTTRDIHRQKKIEHELVRKSENLKELNATKDKFFKILAHDLRNPFFGISGVTEILKERLSNIPNYDTAELQKMVNLIQASTGSASALLENLMEWAKAQTGSLQIDLVEFNINKEIEKVIDLIKGSAFHKNITIEFKLENVNSVLADSYLTNTILRNLLSNSIKFTPIGGNIKIVVKQTGKNVEIAITDTGIGIPEESIKKLFRIDSKFTMLGTEKEKGTGLGLIICKEFAERQNGFIRVQSAVGEGSTFTLCLPHI